MAHGPRYVVPFRRRREGKTDYRKRLRLLLSGKTRIVVRRSLYNVWVQFVEYDAKGDRVLLTVHSKHLAKEFGWKAYRKNIPTAYLVGLLAGIKAKELGITEGVLDLGRQKVHKKGVLFSVLKGLLDAGINVPHDPEVLPDESRIRGEHIAEYAKKLKEEDPEKYKKHFSNYLKNGLDPEDLPKHFDEIKEKILSKAK